MQAAQDLFPFDMSPVVHRLQEVLHDRDTELTLYAGGTIDKPSPGTKIGHFALRQGLVVVTVELARDHHHHGAPTLYVNDIRNNSDYPDHGQGKGREMCLQILDIAQSSGIDHASADANGIGRYANATYFPNLSHQSRKMMKLSFDRTLNAYAEDDTVSETVQKKRREWIDMWRTLFSGHTNLGELVKNTRLPIEEGQFKPFGTLARMLFLHETAEGSYHLEWNKKAIDLAQRELIHRPNRSHDNRHLMLDPKDFGFI